MGNPIHTIDLVDGSVNAQPDRLLVWTSNAVAFTTGGTAGAQTFAVSFTGSFPSTYNVFVNPSIACFDSVAGKTSTGFNVILTPTLIASTLASGTFDILVVA